MNIIIPPKFQKLLLILISFIVSIVPAFFLIFPLSLLIFGLGITAIDSNEFLIGIAVLSLIFSIPLYYIVKRAFKVTILRYLLIIYSAFISLLFIISAILRITSSL